jgi:hypothetical protein
MRRCWAVDTARAARAIRGLWPDRNPLRRAVDRAEAAVVAGLAVALVVVAPLTAFAAGHIAYSLGSRTALAEQAAWHRAPAVLLAAPGAGDDNQVPVRWTAPDGTRHTGAIPAPPGARAGRTVTVWVDAAGRLTGTPLQLSQVWDLVALVTGLAALITGLALLGVGQLAYAVLGRRRLAAWDADWRATEPQWSRRP